MKNSQGESLHELKMLFCCMLMTICFVCFAISAFAAFVLACAALLLTIFVGNPGILMESGVYLQFVFFVGTAICLSFIFLKASRRLNRACNQLHM